MSDKPANELKIIKSNLYFNNHYIYNSEKNSKLFFILITDYSDNIHEPIT